MLCREMSLCEHILFLGKVRDISHVLQISDVFMLPSETESFGLAALEAMAVGVPVISSNTGGIPEVNVDAFSGYLSNVGDIDQMASNALHVLDEAHLESFKMNAKTQAERFSLDRVLPLYEEIYTKLTKPLILSFFQRVIFNRVPYYLH